MKKFFLVVLTACLLFGMLSNVSAAQDAAPAEGCAPAAISASDFAHEVSSASSVEGSGKKSITEIEPAAKPLDPSVPLIYDPSEHTGDLGLFRTLGSVSDRPAFGIDVSCWQGKIDWETAANYIDFAIIRCGYGVDVWYQDDECWEYNVSECERLGIPYGVYLYSYSESAGQSISEAAHVVRLLEGHHPTLPVYLDLEDVKTVGRMNPDALLKNVKLFCDGVQAAGYQPGVYSCLEWENRLLYASDYDRWPRWVSHWSSKCGYTKSYVMWQYGSGYVPGIDGLVDMDYLYSGLPKIKDEWHCGGGPACPGYGFSDMPKIDSWKHEGIDFCIEHSLMNGISSTRFAPDSPVTRGQVVAVLHRMANSPKKEYEGRFSDVRRGEWYTQAVEWAAASGIVKGTSANSFSPCDYLTREQLATILYRCFGSTKTTGSLSRFSDAHDVSAYAYDAMRWATANGIINGVNVGGRLLLCPGEYVTRAQMASIIMRSMQ